MADQTTILIVHAVPSGPARTADLMGREHHVVPAVLVRSQVLVNNLGRTLLPPEAITDDWAAAWNGIPVVAGEHPTVRGRHVSARSPTILNARGVGFIFGAKAEQDGGDRRLKAEIWIDAARADAVPELGVILSRLEEGKTVELSTGFPVTSQEVTGAYNGESYDLVLHPTGTDHLAVFVEGKGACSLADGCGLGVNHRGDCNPEEKPMELQQDANATVTNLESQGSATPVELVDPGGGDPQTQDEGWVRRMYNKFVEHLQLFPEPAGNQSDEDRRRAVWLALRDRFGGLGKDIWIESMFSDERQVVFQVESTNGENGLFRSDFEEADGGMIELSDPVAVRQVTTFEPVANEAADDTTPSNKELGNMTREQAIAALTEAGPLDAAALGKLSDCHLGALLNVGGGDEGVTPDTEDAPVGNEALAALQASIAVLTEKLDATTGELVSLRDATRPAVEEQVREREALIAELSGNERVPFSQEELEAKGLEELGKIRALTRGESYSARGAPRQTTKPLKFMPVRPYYETTDAEVANV